MKLFSFLKRSYIGLQISDHSLRFVELRGRRKPQLLKFGEIGIPRGTVVAGEIVDVQKLGHVLSILRKDIKIKSARISIPTEHVSFFRIGVRNLRRKTISGAVKAYIKEVTSVIPRILFDYKVLKKTKDGYEIQVYFISKRIVDCYLGALKRARIKPLGFEPESYATLRALQFKEEDDTTLVVDIDEEQTCISVASGSTPLFMSTSKTGHTKLLDTIQKSFKIDEREALKIIYELEGSNNSRLSQIIFDYFTIVGEEIKKHYINWNLKEQKRGGSNIEKIIVCGRGSQVLGCVDYLSRYLRDKVELANPWVNIVSFDRYIPEMSFNASLRYVTALGLALG